MIIDLQRRLAECGRIRIGQQVPTGRGKTRPEKLSTFRLTSPDRHRIATAAHMYGGQASEWEAPAGMQWEVITETDALNVIVPPSDMSFSQHYELWSAGGCQRRCDGRTESISDGPCMCDPDKRQCDIHTRLSVMLRDLPGLGVWRIDTSGYYAAVELQGAVEVVQMAAGRGQMLPARLRLEQRVIKRPGQATRRFAVPVLDIEVSPAQLLGSSAPMQITAPDTPLQLEQGPRQIDGGAPLTPVPESVPEAPARSVAEQAAAAKPKPKRSNAAQPVPSTGVKPRTAAQRAANEPPPPEPPDEPDVPEEASITPAQSRKMHVLFNQAEIVDRVTRMRISSYLTKRDLKSSNELTKQEASELIETMQDLANQGDLAEVVTALLEAADEAALAAQYEAEQAD